MKATTLASPALVLRSVITKGLRPLGVVRIRMVSSSITFRSAPTEGEILGASPATVKKHLERVYVKLGVEPRTAAAGMAMNRIRQLHPQFEA